MGSYSKQNTTETHFTAAVEKRLKYISISFITLCHAYYIFSKNIIYFLLYLVRFFSLKFRFFER